MKIQEVRWTCQKLAVAFLHTVRSYFLMLILLVALTTKEEKVLKQKPEVVEEK